ncbi:ROK family protein [Carboxylicivirga sediminis]|uniref:ROK family protein n=1 Tax=Carboxylicivirga sediminis TaxID=2006564 RepID=A0A941F2I0_9BACT|nr:ROK family protein [Carboxylicivirga sediminis]MBR8534550.1 ROK family protein [Carboxylicivirga sediminis]
MKKVSVGVDIGGTNTAIGVVDEMGHVLTKDSISTPSHGDINKYIEDLSAAINKLITNAKLMNEEIEIIGIGVGAPNGNYYSGTIEYAPNLSFKGVVHVVKLLKAHFPDLEAIALTNDANAAAIGEMIYGGAKGMKNFVMYTLGTGVGSGVVVNGDLVYGHDGFAGECGHTTLVPGGRLCGCGAQGHLEAYCSAPGMKRTAFELLAKYNATDSPLANHTYNDLTSKMIYDAAVAGDKVALEVFELTGHHLGQGIADTIHHLSPEAIFLFGGPLAAGELILKPTKESIEKHLLPIFKDKIQLLPSKLDAGDAAIVGASALAWKELNK